MAGRNHCFSTRPFYLMTLLSCLLQAFSFSKEASPQHAKPEYPLEVKVTSPDRKLFFGDSINVRVVISNKGDKPIKFLKLAVPAISNFDVEQQVRFKSSSGGDTVQGAPPNIAKLVTPSGDQDWTGLLPGDSLVSLVGIDSRIDRPGTYSLSLILLRRILIQVDGKAAYTHQFRWPSNKVNFTLKKKAE